MEQENKRDWKSPAYFVMKREQAEIGIQLQESLSLYVRGTGELPGHIRESRKELKQRLLVLKAKGVNGIPVPSGPKMAQAS